MKYIAIIETSDVGAKYTGEACRRLGYEPLFLFQENNYQADTLNQLKEFSYIATETNDANRLFQILKKSHYQVAMVTTFLDSRLPVAAELAQLMNIPGLPVELINLKDKLQVYIKAPHLFPASYEFNRQSINIHELKKFLREQGKIILKPRLTAGGLGVQIVNSEKELIESLQFVKDFQAASHLQADEWMAQSFKTGQLISVEGYSFQGKVHFWGATGRKKIENTESIAYFPHEIQNHARVEYSIYFKMQNQVTELLQSLNLKTTFFHIEFMVTEMGESFIIDPNIGRIGGGGLLEVIALSYQVTPTDVCEFILRLSLLGEVDKSSCLSADHSFQDLISASTIMYGSHQAGQLNRVIIPEEFSFFHTQILNNNTHIPAMGNDNWAWVGILSMPTNTVEALIPQMRLVVNDKQEALCF